MTDLPPLDDRRPAGVWVAVEIAIHDDPRMLSCDLAAELLWHRARGYVGKAMTDGLIPAKWVARQGDLDGLAAAAQLVQYGLWRSVTDGFEDPAFIAWNRSASEVEALRNARREAGRRGGLARSAEPAEASAKQLLKQVPSNGRGNGSSRSQPHTPAPAHAPAPAQHRQNRPPQPPPAGGGGEGGPALIRPEQGTPRERELVASPAEAAPEHRPVKRRVVPPDDWSPAMPWKKRSSLDFDPVTVGRLIMTFQLEGAAIDDPGDAPVDFDRVFTDWFAERVRSGDLVRGRKQGHPDNR